MHWYERVKTVHGVAIAVVCFCVWIGVARVEAESAAEASQRQMNLKVLSSDLSRDAVKHLMEQYKDELGVGCSYCHTKYTDTDDIDYASEENPMKSKARLMIEMTNEINARFLAQLGDRRYAEPFSCGGCHRGHAKLAESES